MKHRWTQTPGGGGRKQVTLGWSSSNREIGATDTHRWNTDFVYRSMHSLQLEEAAYSLACPLGVSPNGTPEDASAGPPAACDGLTKSETRHLVSYLKKCQRATGGYIDPLRGILAWTRKSLSSSLPLFKSYGELTRFRCGSVSQAIARCGLIVSFRTLLFVRSIARLF